MTWPVDHENQGGAMQESKLSCDELARLLSAEFPEAFNDTSGLVIETVGFGLCRVRQRFLKELLRPGGTISGPTMMRLADVAVYIALLGAVGWVPLAVTTQLNIHFLRKPGQADLIADARLLKRGKRLVVGEVLITTDGQDGLVAQATSTYAMPSLR
jgi:uncharacterized protein (TIGR00369 family)